MKAGPPPAPPTPHSSPRSSAWTASRTAPCYVWGAERLPLRCRMCCRRAGAHAGCGCGGRAAVDGWPVVSWHRLWHRVAANRERAGEGGTLTPLSSSCKHEVGCILKRASVVSAGGMRGQRACFCFRLETVCNQSHCLGAHHMRWGSLNSLVRSRQQHDALLPATHRLLAQWTRPHLHTPLQRSHMARYAPHSPASKAATSAAV